MLETLVLVCKIVVNPIDGKAELVGCALDAIELTSTTVGDALGIVLERLAVGRPKIVSTGGDVAGCVEGVAVLDRVCTTVIVIGPVRPPVPVSGASLACGSRRATLTPSGFFIGRLAYWRCMSPSRRWRQRLS